jgi:hypothetical protein
MQDLQHCKTFALAFHSTRQSSKYDQLLFVNPLIILSFTLIASPALHQVVPEGPAVGGVAGFFVFGLFASG